MPLLRYFSVVGLALLLLLFAVIWLLPEPISESNHVSIERPSIRISSIQKLPERVVFDTSHPQIAVPLMAISAPTELPQSAFAFVQITPGPLPAFATLAEVAPKPPVAVKLYPARKVAAHRPSPQAQTVPAENNNVRQAQENKKPPVRTTFQEDIAGRFGQIFKVNKIVVFHPRRNRSFSPRFSTVANL